MLPSPDRALGKVLTSDDEQDERRVTVLPPCVLVRQPAGGVQLAVDVAYLDDERAKQRQLAAQQHGERAQRIARLNNLAAAPPNLGAGSDNEDFVQNFLNAAHPEQYYERLVYLRRKRSVILLLVLDLTFFGMQFLCT